MKSRASPAAIGMFITGAIVIIFLSVVLFGGGRFLKKTKPYLLTFRESVTGLNVGAPVKVMGVTVGKVSDIWLGVDRKEIAPMINVLVRIDRQKMASQFKDLALNLDDRQHFEIAIKERGLRARLELLSLLSGQLYIAADWFPGQPGFQLNREQETGYWEIPTLPSSQQELMNSVKTVVRNLGKLDLAGISDQVKGLITDIRGDLSKIEFGKVNAQLVADLKSVDVLLNDPNLKSALTNLDVTLKNAGEVTAKLNRETNPLLASVGKDLQKAGEALDEATKALAAVKSQLQPGAPLSSELIETLQRASRALDAVRQLADDLRRNPNSIITGKSQQKP